jgi:hypothetical protein
VTEKGEIVATQVVREEFFGLERAWIVAGSRMTNVMAVS